MPTVISVTTVKINRLLREKILSHPLSTTFAIQITYIHAPITLQYKLINCKNEFQFVYKPVITQ
jgi:hypothetical protein